MVCTLSICLHMYVCLYVYMYVYIETSMYVHTISVNGMHTIYVCTYIVCAFGIEYVFYECMYVCMHVCMYVCMYTIG